MKSTDLGWLDRNEYPFQPHFFEAPSGRMHYVDEGAGRPVVFVHGNPTWSFLFRKTISSLAPLGSFRCVAPDHLGFGLSEKPLDFNYLPEDHARNFAAFMDSLDLTDATMVVGDWGGPIGLSYAIENSDRISSLVITNTWMWSVRNDWYYQGFSGFMGGPIGRYLIRKKNFFASNVLKSAFGDKSRLTPEIHRHYLMPLAVPEERKGCWVFPGRIIGSSDWLSSLWERREALASKKILIAWGMKDIAFRKKELQRWKGAFPKARVVEYPECGHYVAEERGEDLASEIAKLDG
jgi:haloalkane dehalogenase